MDDSFFVLLALAGLIFFVLGPVSFFLTLGARGRVSELEQTVRKLEYRLRRFEEAGPAPSAAPPETAAQAVAPAEVPPPAPVEVATSPLETVSSEAAPETLVAEDAPEQAPPAPAKPRRSRSLEESFGTRWTVWVGGLALALGALLLVRYSIEAGLFGPAARVAFGLLLAAALIVAGEVLRRRETPAETEANAATAKPSIPAMLTAAGTVAAFGAIYAAHGLYGFIGAAPAFIALGVVGVACMFASALHGPSLAGLGLVGAFIAPLLVDSDNPNPWPVVLYLAVLTAVAYGLARLRLWLWLAMAAAGGAVLWGLVFASQIDGSMAGQFFPATMIHIVVQMALAGYFLAWDPSRTTSEENATPDAIATAAPLIFGLLAIGTLMEGSFAGQFGNGWVMYAGFVIATLTAIGFLVAPAAAVFAGAGLLAAAAARLWPATISPDARATLPDFAADFFIGPVQSGLFIGFFTVIALALLALGGWRLLIARHLPAVTLAIYAATAALAPLALLIVAWMRIAQGERSFAFAASAAALALIFVGAATKFRDLEGRGDTPNARFATGVFASAAIAALALGFTFALEGGALVVALAAAALGAAYVGVKLEIPALRWCVAGLGVIIAARLAWEPRVIAQPGTTPIFNWLLYGYGAPALAFGYAARLMRRHGGEDTPVRVAQALTILFAAFLVFFEIRHLINNGDPFAAAAPTLEQGLHAVAAFSFAIVLTKLDAARSSIIFRIASLGFGVLSFVYAVVGLGGFANPYFSFRPVEGGPIFNALLIAYLLPALLAFVLSIVANGVRPAWYVTMARIVAILLTFGYLTLETRRLFQGPYLGLLRHTSGAEFYAYSAVWLVFGVFLLAWGLLRGSREARLASAVFVAVSVLKVFLFDLSGLEGILRALSFIGLGAVLIGIGLVYQKLVFVRPTPSPENPPPDRLPGAAP